MQDWIHTDASLHFVQMQPELLAAADAAKLAARQRPSLMPLLGDSSIPCVSCGLWHAYAGNPGRAFHESPRGRVRAAVERLLECNPGSRTVVVTGHSLGGALATLCAFDLLAAGSVMHVTLVSFAAPRVFNVGFRDATRALIEAGKLDSLRVTNSEDIIPRLGARVLGNFHPAGPSLILDPTNADAPLRYYQEVEKADKAPLPLPDPAAHTMHATYLSGTATPRRPSVTVPITANWPVPPHSIRNAKPR